MTNVWVGSIVDGEMGECLFFFSYCSFVLTQKNQKVKENLKALRWSFFRTSLRNHVATITAIIAQEAATPNFPLPARFFCFAENWSLTIVLNKMILKKSNSLPAACEDVANQRLVRKATFFYYRREREQGKRSVGNKKRCSQFAHPCQPVCW